jgi:hypothetical protein
MFFILALMALLGHAKPQASSDPSNPPQQNSQATQVGQGYVPQASESQVQTPFSPNPGESSEFTRIVNSFIARENQLMGNLRNYSPRVETYIQDMRPDPELGAVPQHDHYFLERLAGVY